MIDWLLRFCSKKKIKPAILTRGYKAKRNLELQLLNKDTYQLGNSEVFGDEPWMLFKRNPSISFYISPNRINASKFAEKQAPLLILDDGMQHRKLGRNLEIVLIDSLAGLGNNKVVPLGPLREPLTGLSRADVIIYNRTNLVNSGPIRKNLSPYLHPKAAQFDASFLPESVVSSQTEKHQPLDLLSNKRCILISGIGNPMSFEKTLTQSGAVIEGHLVFEDHQEYDEAAIRRIKEYIERRSCDLVICTEKDWVKLEKHRNRLLEFWWVRMALEIDAGFDEYLENFFLTNDINPDKHR